MSLLTQQMAEAEAALTDSDRRIALRFLDEHLARGGLDIRGYNELHEVLRVFSEISLLLFPPSVGPDEIVMHRVRFLSKRVADTFHAFGERIGAHLKSAQRAMQELPELAVSQENICRHNLQIWRRRLRRLHAPSKDDVNLYRYFLAEFDDEVYCPLLQLHRVQPEHHSWQLHPWFDHIRSCMISIEENIEEANKIVTELDTEFTFGSWMADGEQRDAKSSTAKQPPATKKIDSEKRATLSKSESNTDLLESLEDFFKGPEVANGGNNLTTLQKEYHIAASNAEGGLTTPRVFTRSFDELEDSVKDLRLHHINFSTSDADHDAGGEVKIKDFALRTPCLIPSPATLLTRREALCAREPTWEHRLIGGQVVHSRRPHDRERAQTVDERGGGLDAWLAESPSPGRAGSIYSRVPHRQQTL
ncbi:hypothetical protein MBLNU13_g01306t2 [Cladosporium sp. NU13]